MALNIATFKTRALTALIFVIVMLGGILGGFWSFVALFTLIHFGAWYEFVKLIKKIYPQHFMPYLLGGLLYITMPITMLIDIRTTTELFMGEKAGLILVCILIGSIWINDTMAYLVGSMIGKTPLSPISPKKTWEGTVGGSLIAIIAVALLSWYMLDMHNIWLAVGLPLFAAFFGTLGDLFESKLKRMANVKDSGNFMPGHGGFLDRFDSLLVAIPFVWLLITLIQQYS
jgi:phosphatidate cytidylyltransferase